VAGALARLPDTARVARLSGTASAGCTAAAAAHGDLASSALGPAAAALGSVDAGAGIDVAGLGGTLGRALHAIGSAVPPGLAQDAHGIADAFGQARDAVSGNPLLGLLPEGSALRDVVGQIIAEAVALFEQRVGELAQQLLGADEVAELRAGLALVDGLTNDFPGHAGELAGFLRGTLLAFDPDVLQPVRAHLRAVLALSASLDAGQLASLLDPLTAGAGTARDALAAAVAALDPADQAAYDAVVRALDGVSQAATAARGVLEPLCGGVATAAAALDPEALLARYAAVLDAVELARHELIDDVLDATVAVLDDLTARVQAASSPAELGEAVRRLGTGVREAVASSAIGQARAKLVAFIGQVRDTIAAVPLGPLSEALRGGLGQVGQEIGALGLDDAAAKIEAGFAALVSTVQDTARGAAAEVTQVLQALLAQIDALPAGDLVGAIKDAVDQLGEVVQEVHDGAAGVVDDLRRQLDSLSTVSYQPVSDEVIGEIDAIKAKLQAMNPDALSEESKLAVRAALAVLQALDVEDRVVKALGEGYRTLDGAVRRVLDDIAAELERLHRAVGELDPAAVLAPVTAGLSAMRSAVDSLDAASLTAGLRGEIDRLGQQLARLHPGTVLSPLQGPYDAVWSTLSRLDPQDWGAPLSGLHAELAAAADRLDLSPVFAELDARRQDLVELIRDTVTLSVSRVDLPDPLRGWLLRVLPLVSGISDLLTFDPATGLRKLSRIAHESFTLSALYQPLEEIFQSVLAALRAVPPADLVAAATPLRDAVTALDALEPQAIVTELRAGHRRLADATAPAVLAPLMSLRDLRAAFHARVDVAVTTPAGQVARVDARFDAALALLDAADLASVVSTVTARQDEALAALRASIDAVAVDPGLAAAQASFSRLREAAARLVPPELPRTGALDAATVIAACEHWRPAARGQQLDTRLSAFVTALAPAAAAVEAAADAFADDVQAAAQLIDPLALDPVVAEVFDAVRAQVEALDPSALLDALRTEVYLPVVAAAQAVDPSRIGQRLDAAYDAARTAVLGELNGLVASVTQALQAHLAAVRAAVDGLLDQLGGTVEAAAGALRDVVTKVGDLVFVDLVARLRAVLDTLATSFSTELGRIKVAFDAMLAAAPLGQQDRPGVTT
jgi:hypothetical protein